MLYQVHFMKHTLQNITYCIIDWYTPVKIGDRINALHLTKIYTIFEMLNESISDPIIQIRRLVSIMIS